MPRFCWRAEGRSRPDHTNPCDITRQIYAGEYHKEDSKTVSCYGDIFKRGYILRIYDRVLLHIIDVQQIYFAIFILRTPRRHIVDVNILSSYSSQVVMDAKRRNAYELDESVEAQNQTYNLEIVAAERPCCKFSEDGKGGHWNRRSLGLLLPIDGEEAEFVMAVRRHRISQSTSTIFISGIFLCSDSWEDNGI